MARLARPAALVLLALAAGWGVWRFATPEPVPEAPEARRIEPDGAPESLGAPALRGLPHATPRADPGAPTSLPLEEPEDREASPEVRLRIDVVDANSGRDVAATWNVGTPWADPRAGREWESAFLPSGVARTKLLWREDNYLSLTLTVRPPEGHVLLVPPARLNLTWAVGLTDLIAVVPVIREAVLDVRVVGPDGHAADGARLVHLALGGVAWPHTVEDGPTGTLRVRGIPHLPGERITAGVEWGIEHGEVALPTLEMELEEVGSEEPPSNLTTNIPESRDTPWTVELRLSHPTGSLTDHTETDNDMPFEESLGEEAGPAAPQGRLRLRFLDLLGRPVLAEPLLGIKPDAKGEVLVERLGPGPLERSVQVPGRLPARLDAVIRATEETVVTLREPVGGRLEVTVVDEEGRPRPTAVLQVRGRVFFDIEGTTQRADLFTDHLGRRSIARVEPGEAEVHASWGGRHGFEKVTVIDGETTRVRIVAR